MTTATQTSTTRLNYHGPIGVAAMQGRGFYYPWSIAVADDGRLFVQGPGQSKLALYAESETKFFIKEEDAQITFNLDATGEAQSIILHRNGQNQEAKRVDE